MPENTKMLNLEKYWDYEEFIEQCKEKDYDDNLVLHKHHIIPKNATNDEERLNSNDNFIKLSVEDHVKAHLLIAECFDENSKEYIDNLRSARVLNRKSIKNKEILEKISKQYEGEKNPFYGKTHSEETIEKLRETSKKRKGKSYEEIYGEKRAKLEREKRSKKTRSDEEYKRDAKKVSRTLKGKFKGSNNPNAQRYLVNGEYFGSRTEVVNNFKGCFETIKKYNKVEKVNKKLKENE